MPMDLATAVELAIQTMTEVENPTTEHLEAITMLRGSLDRAAKAVAAAATGPMYEQLLEMGFSPKKATGALAMMRTPEGRVFAKQAAGQYAEMMRKAGLDPEKEAGEMMGALARGDRGFIRKRMDEIRKLTGFKGDEE